MFPGRQTGGPTGGRGGEQGLSGSFGAAYGVRVAAVPSVTVIAVTDVIAVTEPFTSVTVIVTVAAIPSG